jgi:excisionase family DNA binding protein
MASQITARQAAESLGVTVARVHVLIREGRLLAEKIGVQYLIRPADLERVRHRKPGRPASDQKPSRVSKADASRRETLRKVGLPVALPKPRDHGVKAQVKALRKNRRDRKRK